MTPNCDFCGRKANVLYYPEMVDPSDYVPKLSGKTLCRKCDSNAVKALAKKEGT